MIATLENDWKSLASTYCEANLVDELWVEIKTKYSSKSRYYHNLLHVHNMLLQAEKFQSNITHIDNLKFAIWYHDIIYKSTKKDNEEKSAILAQKRLKSINFDEKHIKMIENLIISTKSHALIDTKNNDNAYLLDFDLSILGSSWENYKIYCSNIRKEYKVYPDFLYNPGRKKVLNHFLERETLYFTDDYKNLFEEKARENLNKELELL